MKSIRVATYYPGITALIVLLFLLLLCVGPVRLSIEDVFVALFGKGVNPQAELIVLQTRLPVAISAACCGALLSSAGLMMQTLFHNPLAGPSVLGISSGASFGVALFMLGAGGLGGMISGDLLSIISIITALAGAFLTIAILITFSSILKSGLSLLIVGLMLSYLFSSGVSLLNYFSKADEIRSFLVWGLGSFAGMRLGSSLLLLGITIMVLIPSFFFIKPLNAFLLGERHVESVGYSVKSIRGGILVLTGFMVAVPTAFCGPIGFIGLIVPHICRILLRSSNHSLLIPATMLCGAAVMLACALAGVLPAGRYGVLPINVITPLVGVPFILYLLVRRNKLLYF